MSKLLIEESPLQVLPSLALKIGLNEAIVLQQLHYLLRDPKFGKRIAEQQWIFNTIEQWRCSYFPFWSIRTIKTVFSNLSRMKLVVTCQPEGRVSRRKYYRIDTERLDQISDGAKFVPSMVQDSSIGNVQNSSLPNTKTSSETSSKTTKGFSSEKPHSCSEKKKKKRNTPTLPSRRPTPFSEEEMARELAEHGIEYAPDYDDGFWEKMEENGWTCNGERIWDWIAFYDARLLNNMPGYVSIYEELP